MNRIITIGREFGSGGRELGYRIAEKLQIAYYDQEIITEIAKRTALSEDYIRQIEERRPIMHFPIHTGHSFYLTSEPSFYPEFSIYTKQHELLRELSCKSDCIIVGRCADHILREQKPVRIFAYADMESRIKRCMERHPEGGRESNRSADEETDYGDRPQPCKVLRFLQWAEMGCAGKLRPSREYLRRRHQRDVLCPLRLFGDPV